MVERKTPFRGKREYVTFGDGFPGFGETDKLKASRWNADLFEEAPVSEPENAPVTYTGDEDFSTRGRYSGVGVIVDETGEFDPEPVRCGSAGPLPGKNAESVRRDSMESVLVKSPEPAQSVEAKLDLSLFRELYRSRDGRLVFFEHCATGHLAAVDASKLV
ncbi:hypothetical protein [Ellagibacter isourolithinifaciens]|uniref:hypothetical protein n=1 Tax=Ellagibacter isourolithinifaciens TaxID=2137581 RepID=UPI003A921E02